ncbi:hypothetical protein RhiirA5_438075, partial [Rhizophagus irregularis]
KRSNKQKSRFQRACRSVFYNRGNNRKSQRRVDSLEEKLQRARQHRFLFLPSQHIYKPIQHVNHHNPFRQPTPRYPRDDSISATNTSSPATNSQPVPVENENIWHDKLGIWIPNSLLPYVTDEPVYTSNRQAKIKGQHFTPGCAYWFDGIKKRKEAHELALRQQKNQEAYDIARLALENELSARAQLWGTSVNRIEY